MGVQPKSLRQPDESLVFEHGTAEWVVLGDLTVGRTILHPTWRWSEHIKPLAGTEWCESAHTGVMISGRLHILLRDGTEAEFGPDDVFAIPPGHDGWVVGDEPAVSIEWTGLRGWARAIESMSERVLATVLFTDIVGSTTLASQVGDARWRETLAQHDARARDALRRFRGREIKTTGDGFLAVFDGAARAVRCAAELAAARDDGLSIRAAVHTGEIELAGDDVRGIAVHEAARVLALAEPDEVLVTAITRELVASAGLTFEDRGEFELRGLDGARRLFAVTTATKGA